MLSINSCYVFVIFCVLFAQMILDSPTTIKVVSKFFNIGIPIISTIIVLYDSRDAIIWASIGILAILFYLLQTTMKSTNSENPYEKPYDDEKLKIVAKKYGMSFNTAERMLTYSYKFNKEETANMYICICIRNGCKYYYIRNKNNNTIVLFYKIKIEIPPTKNLVKECKVQKDNKDQKDTGTSLDSKRIKDLQNKLLEISKNHKEDKQLEIIKKILKGDSNVDKIKENVKLLEEIVDIFKDYEFDNNEKSEMKLKKYIKSAKKIINVCNNQIQLIENSNNKTQQLPNVVVNDEIIPKPDPEPLPNIESDQAIV